MSAFADFANRIEKEAQRLGLSNADLAEKASLSAGLITQIFGGQKSDARMSTIQALTKAVFGDESDVRLQVVTSADTAGESNHSSTPKPGDDLNADARVLRARNDKLQKENVALRIAIRAHAGELRDVAGKLAKLAGGPRRNLRKAASGKPGAS